MINFSGLNYRSWLGKLVRLPLRLLPREMEMPIWQGPLRGQRWIVGSLNHGCWLGTYECDKQKRLAAAIQAGSVFFDVGAHVGFYSLLASRQVGETGRVVAFEPSPRNLAYLERHLRLNAVGNVTLFKAAVAEHPGKARFHEDGVHTMGKMSESGGLTVDSVALDDLFTHGLVPLPDCIKIDVEGAEAAVLRGARQILVLGRPTIFLATHGREVHAECIDLLQSLGYRCTPLDRNVPADQCDELIAKP